MENIMENKMYQYTVGFSSHDGGSYVVLSHHLKFTESQLKQTIEMIVNGMEDKHLMFANIFDDIIDIMVKRYNFFKSTYECEVSFYEFAKLRENGKIE